MELTIAILAALYQRQHDRAPARSSTSRWPRRCCSSTTTSTASCGTAPRTRRRSATSGPATTSCSRPPTATASSSAGTRPSGARSTLFLRAFDVPHLADDPRFADVAGRKEHAAELRQLLLEAAAQDPRRGDVRGDLHRHQPRRRPPAQRPRSSPTPTGRASAGRSPRCPTGAAARSASPTRRGTSAAPTSACAAGPSTAARTTGPCSPTCSATTTPPSTPSRPTASCRAGCRHGGLTGDGDHVPGGADAGDARDAADRGRRLGLRDQVGRLPHAGVRRGRTGAAAELEPARRHRPLPGDAGRWPTSSAAQRAVLDGELVVLDDRRPAALRADPAQGGRPPRGRATSCSTCWPSTATTRSACPTRSGAACCASSSTTGRTGRCRPTASATGGRCWRRPRPRSWRA